GDDEGEEGGGKGKKKEEEGEKKEERKDGKKVYMGEVLERLEEDVDEVGGGKSEDVVEEKKGKRL
ncbi:hypothetical protein DBV05_g12021, partial [Lasiodiplodia theobromae]